MSHNALSQQIRERRKALGLSLSQLARRVNTSPATLSRYERGWDRFEVYTLRKLAAALGCRLFLRLEPAEAGSPATGRPAATVHRLGRLFWDRPLRSTDFREHPSWIVKRVLEYGSLADVQALVTRWGRHRLLRTVAGLQFDSARTENFWKQILEKEGIPCTPKYSRKAARNCWPGWNAPTPRS